MTANEPGTGADFDVETGTDVDVAILHDRFPGIGGGEEFAIEAARVLEAPIYTTYVAEGTDLPSDVDVIPIRQSKYTSLPFGPALEWKNEGMNPLETLNVSLDLTDAHEDLAEYDVILESAPLSKSYVPTVDQRIVHYPHSPPRWLYDSYRDRLSSFTWPFVESGIKAYAKGWRALDKEANDYVDRFVANSELVRDRIRRYYGRDADVVYPPVTGDWRNEGDDGYFVTWSRLAPEKRIDLIAEAFAGMDERLVIAGDGEQREKLERMASMYDNIEVRGYVEDVESLVARATAVVYAPRREDFGLVGAETMMAGKPLLGVNEGFTRYQVRGGRTGLLFEPTIRSIRDAVGRFDPDDFDPIEIREAARRYEYARFAEGLREVVAEVATAEPGRRALEGRRREERPPQTRPADAPPADDDPTDRRRPSEERAATRGEGTDATADGEDEATALEGVTDE
ncbi:glycosyltransferase [Natrialbaceae archaeon GCM10025810]|uniref:glycosyltransferase n=1 Tax=Halovalidus salilacus TaxID=3075124 RepID=UPI0036207244